LKFIDEFTSGYPWKKLSEKINFSSQNVLDVVKPNPKKTFILGILNFFDHVSTHPRQIVARAS
jgi:hypothetical protein